MEINKKNLDETSFFGSMVKEEKTMISNSDDQESISLEIAHTEISAINTVPFATQPKSCNIQPSTPKNQGSDDELLKSAKVEMGEVKVENERLKLLLTSIVKDYQSLQKHFSDTLQQQEEEAKKLMVSAHTHQQDEEPELVSLSLGRFPSHEPRKDDKNIITKDDKQINGELALGLSSKFESLGSFEIVKNIISNSDNYNFEDHKEDNLTEMWPPSKILKTTKHGEDEASQHAELKKARVSIRARCDAQTMNDGCQWRKYGQKIAKGNPCPRAYYRCTVSPSCPVRKQVQRCSKDMTILITTYEGTHNHPLPTSATAMASTTSAAVSLLQSHSSSSSLPGSSISSTSAPIAISTHNYSNPNNNSFTTSFQNPTKQFHNFPNASITTCNSHPTITLDLTIPSTSSHFASFSSLLPRSYSNSTSLNFSSTSSEPNSTSWNNFSRYFNHGTLSQDSIKNQIGALNSNSIHGSNQPFQEAYLYHQRPHNYNIIQTSSGSQQAMELTDTITAATKEITANPKFQSALAVAISSFLGNNKSIVDQNESSGLNLKWGTESFSVSSISSSSQNGIDCKSSYLKK